MKIKLEYRQIVSLLKQMPERELKKLRDEIDKLIRYRKPSAKDDEKDFEWEGALKNLDRDKDGVSIQHEIFNFWKKK